MSARAVRSEGTLAALPIAAALVLLLARWLPVRFPYVPNELGIVSLATLERYPQQQETFWLFFSVATVIPLTWGLGRLLRAPRIPVALLVGVEALGAASLLSVLWLPTGLAAALLLLAAAGAAWVSASGRARGGHLELVGLADGRAATRARWRVAAFALGVVLLPLILTPSLWVTLWNLVHAIPDERRVVDGFVFQGHTGQHLAWANALLHGGFHGKDFFCLYGPLYDLGVVGFWALAGRSIVAWDLYLATSRVLGFAVLLLLAGLLVRRRAWIVALPFLVPWTNLRSGWALFGLVLLYGWLCSGRLRWMALAGAVGGTSILYSQEFGLAFLVTLVAALLLQGRARPALVFAAGFAAVIGPLFAWYAANDALVPMLRDVVAYPGYMLAGYGKIPFPALAASIPLDPANWRSQPFLAHQLGYGIPAVCLGALLLALPLASLDPRRPLASPAETLRRLKGDPARTLLVLTAVFGFLSFRTALGRSDILHMLDALPAAALLVVVACDRVSGLWRAGAALRPLAAWRTLALALLVLHSGFLESPRPLQQLRQTAASLPIWLGRGSPPVGSRRVMRVVRWIQLHAEPTDPVLFLPNDAAYYYLTDRPSPIRFVMGHQIVTQAHRREVLEALRARPPRFIVWDHDAARVDGIPDELVFGEELLGWIAENYAEETRLGGVEILARRRTQEARDP